MTTGSHVIGTLTVGGAAQSNTATFGNYSQLKLVLGSAGSGDKLAVRGDLNVSSTGNRLFELGLGPLMLAAVGSSSPGDQQLMTAILAQFGEDGFPAAFYAAKGQPEVAAFLRQGSARTSAKVA